MRRCLLLVALGPLLTGCAAISNPVANGVPVRRLPTEFLAEPKNDRQTIPLTLLRQKPPVQYLLAPGDVLGVWIEGVLGERNQLPPVIQNSTTAGSSQPLAVGVPLPVRENGTLPLPLVEPLRVEGMTVQQAEDAIREAYTVKKQIIVPGRERILVSLYKPRTYRVMVIRQDSGGLTVGTQGLIGNTKRGTGFVLELAAYENDVLTALTRTGGLPGLDAQDEVLVERGAFNGDQDVRGLLQAYEALPPGCHFGQGAEAVRRQVTHIPLRTRPNRPVHINPQDVLLQNGDILFIEERNFDVWFAGGLLPGSQFPLPRDRDLDVVEAVALAGFPVQTSGVTIGNLAGTFLTNGAGFPSPSLVTVLRRTPDGGQVPIRVELNRALRDPRERLLIMPNDFLVLQEKPEEAFTRYLLSTMTFNFSWLAISTPRTTGIYNINLPQGGANGGGGLGLNNTP